MSKQRDGGMIGRSVMLLIRLDSDTTISEVGATLVKFNSKGLRGRHEPAWGIRRLLK